jgi:DNA-directed RNA polymerase subunit RPC12/RpoP
MLKSEQTSTIRVDEFVEDSAFRLLARPVRCPECGADCDCTGYAEAALVYDCLLCGRSIADDLNFAPVFALDAVTAAAQRHFQIDCPYCAGTASLVGGSPQQGYFFVCQDRCHTDITRTIRRF